MSRVGTLFDLPSNAFESNVAQEAPLAVTSLLAVTTDALQKFEFEAEVETHSPAQSGQDHATAVTGSTCLACGIGTDGNAGFKAIEDQRAHFKTDWHRYNVKLRIAGLPAVSEQAFEKLVENNANLDEVGSLSGSESDDSDNEDEGNMTSTGPQFAFRTSDGKQLAVWRCLVAPDQASSSSSSVDSSRTSLATLEHLRSSTTKICVLLFRGGHFAAAVYTIEKPKSAKADFYKEVIHKTYHRYVVRAKAGGKQSSHDAGGKFARSAGARLRRYNEAALENEIAETLEEWKDHLKSCSLIFYQASASSMKSLFGGDKPVLDKKDPRFRKIPFVTRRPTLSEIKRTLRVLTSVFEIPIEERVDNKKEPIGVSSIDEAKETALAKAAAEKIERLQVEEEDQASREAEARRKKAEKKARQKAKQKAEQQAKVKEAPPPEEPAVEDINAEDAILQAAAEAAAFSSRPRPKIHGSNKATSGGPPPRLTSKPQASEDAVTRRARLAAAAEARLAALQQASQQQKLW